MLLEYMYRGSIAVKQHELADILRTASSLKIRGLTTAELPPLEEKEKVVVAPHGHHQVQQQRLAVATSNSAASSRSPADNSLGSEVQLEPQKMVPS